MLSPGPRGPPHPRLNLPSPPPPPPTSASACFDHMYHTVAMQPAPHRSDWSHSKPLTDLQLQLQHCSTRSSLTAPGAQVRRERHLLCSKHHPAGSRAQEGNQKAACCLTLPHTATQCVRGCLCPCSAASQHNANHVLAQYAVGCISSDQ